MAKTPKTPTDRPAQKDASTSSNTLHPSRGPATGKYPIASEERAKQLLGDSGSDFQISLGLNRRK